MRVPAEHAGTKVSLTATDVPFRGFPMAAEDVELKEYEEVISTYYDDIQVKALIGLKVDTKYAEDIALDLMKNPQIIDVFLVTGDTDIILKT